MTAGQNVDDGCEDWVELFGCLGAEDEWGLGVEGVQFGLQLGEGCFVEDSAFYDVQFAYWFLYLCFLFLRFVGYLIGEFSFLDCVH